MPTQTFYNLPEEKRVRLMQAIRSELARVPYDELSINQIVKHAGIPRGSFYQYFTDKQDMLEFLLRDYRRNIVRQIDNSLKHNGGDIFQMFLDILDFTFEFVTEEKNNSFFKNIFSDIRINMNLLQRHARESIYNAFARALKSRIKMDELDIRNDDDLDNMLGVLLPLTGDAFSCAFFDTSSYEKVRQQYAGRLDLIKRGFAKEKGVLK